MLDQPRGARGVSESPAGATVGLSKAPDHQGTVVESCRGGTGSIGPGRIGEDEFIVDFVGDELYATTATEIRQIPNLVFRQDHARGISRAIHQDELCSIGDQWLDSRGRHAEVWIGIACHHRRAGQMSELRIEDEPRVRHDGLVTFLQKCQAREQETTTRAAGHHRGEVVRIVPAKVMREVTANRIMERGNPLRHGVSVSVRSNGINRRIFHGRWDWEIRLADREIDRPLKRPSKFKGAANAGGVHRLHPTSQAVVVRHR